MRELTKETVNVTHFIPRCYYFNKHKKCLCDKCKVELFFVRFDKETENIWIDARAIYDSENVGFMVRKAIDPEDYRYAFLMNVFKDYIEETD